MLLYDHLPGKCLKAQEFLCLGRFPKRCTQARIKSFLSSYPLNNSNEFVSSSQFASLETMNKVFRISGAMKTVIYNTFREGREDVQDEDSDIRSLRTE